MSLGLQISKKEILLKQFGEKYIEKNHNKVCSKSHRHLAYWWSEDSFV
jgi:hypothetical protein